MEKYAEYVEKWNKAMELIDAIEASGRPPKDDWYRTGIKLGDWVKIKRPDLWGRDYAHDHTKRIFKIVHIQDGRFAVMEWMCPDTFQSVFVGHNMRDIKKVEISDKRNALTR